MLEMQKQNSQQMGDLIQAIKNQPPPVVNVQPADSGGGCSIF
jgi:hypothetical protein